MFSSTSLTLLTKFGKENYREQSPLARKMLQGEKSERIPLLQLTFYHPMTCVVRRR